MDPTPEQQPTADTSALQTRLAEMERQLATERTSRISTEATAFVAQQIAAHKALPAEKQALIDLYTVAAQDDLAHGSITTAAGTTTRVALIQAAQALRPAHTLTSEIIPADQDVTVLNAKRETPNAQQDENAAAAQSARAYAAKLNGTSRK